MQKSLGNQLCSGDNSGAIDGADHTIESPLTTDADEARDTMAAPDSIPGKSPAFQFYPKDFLTDSNVVVMSLQERGAYITLICQCWIDGSLPSDVARLARLCGVPVSPFRKLWPALEPCFRPASNTDRLVHPRLELERRKQREFRRRQAENGRLGGRPRKPEKPKPLQTQTQTEPKKSSAICNLRSSSSDFSQTKTSVSVFVPDEIGERAGKFCNEVYPELYAKYRKGARYVSRPALDFQEALQLCRTWDDERLVKIATVFLTTDHEFAEKGSRTMAQFRSLASWCDSRLAERGIA